MYDAETKRIEALGKISERDQHRSEEVSKMSGDFNYGSKSY
jgi:hypothetical protein